MSTCWVITFLTPDFTRMKSFNFFKLLLCNKNRISGKSSLSSTSPFLSELNNIELDVEERVESDSGR